MDLRVQLIRDHDEGQNISALAEVYGISRKTIYKWLARHAAEGAAGAGRPQPETATLPGQAH